MQNTVSNFESLNVEDFSAYAGEWIAVIDNVIVEHGPCFKEVYKKVKLKFPMERPLIGKVPEKNLISFSIG